MGRVFKSVKRSPYYCGLSPLSVDLPQAPGTARAASKWKEADQLVTSDVPFC